MLLLERKHLVTVLKQFGINPKPLEHKKAISFEMAFLLFNSNLYLTSLG